MKRTHTPGPWIADEFEGLTVIAESKTGGIITEIRASDFKANEQADAQLISAAPEMYEALEAVLKWASAPRDTINFKGSTIDATIKAALKKARGEQ